jgi:hypothetical protein
MSAFNNKKFEASLEDLRAQFANHQLEALVDQGRVLGFHIKRPGTRMYLVELLFGPEGMVIHGDLMIGQAHGAVRARQGFDWWLDAMAADYMAGKFVPVLTSEHNRAALVVVHETFRRLFWEQYVEVRESAGWQLIPASRGQGEVAP